MDAPFELEPLLKANPKHKQHLLQKAFVLLLGCTGFSIVMNLNHALPHSNAFDDSIRTNHLQTAVVKMVNGTAHIVFGTDSDPMAINTSMENVDAVCYAKFNDSLQSIGWSKLWLNAELTKSDGLMLKRHARDAMFAAGFAEGSLTHHRIDQHFQNTFSTFFKNDTIAPQKVKVFLNENLKWLRSQIKRKISENQQTSPDVEHWESVQSIMAQFDGLFAGYIKFTSNTRPLSEVDLFLLNADGDLEDLIPALNKSKIRKPYARHDLQNEYNYTLSLSELSYLEQEAKSLKCSALIRILPNFTDVIWGHTTWDQYTAMNRIYKHYNLPAVRHSKVVVLKTSMSSSPGYISSVDDWYILGNGLAVLETTNGIYNEQLYSTISPKSILTWMRARVANRLSDVGTQWSKHFSKYNSGTYNNQWMVLDLNRFVRGKGFRYGGFTLIEQIPEFIETADLSSYINRNGYWGSYNVPFFDKIYKDSGFLSMFNSSNFSNGWSHGYCPRAKIFQRDANLVLNLDDLKKLMRYNDWKHDKLSEGHASRAISARYDLETGAIFSLDGGIDTKVSSIRQAFNMECDAISGPTNDNNPSFTWNNSSLPRLLHFGHPEFFNFKFEKMVHILPH